MIFCVLTVEKLMRCVVLPPPPASSPTTVNKYTHSSCSLPLYTLGALFLLQYIVLNYVIPLGYHYVMLFTFNNSIIKKPLYSFFCSLSLFTVSRMIFWFTLIFPSNIEHFYSNVFPFWLNWWINITPSVVSMAIAIACITSPNSSTFIQLSD